MFLWRCARGALLSLCERPHRRLCAEAVSFCRRPVVSIRGFCFSSTKMTYFAVERGSPNTPDYRVFINNSDGPISPFHDIPLWADEEKKILNMIVEVPRWTNAKMEISLKEPLNPIKQDMKKGKLRFVANCFPHHGYIWNYGALPQTWENPDHVDANTNCRGDNDPIDIVDIGSRIARRGEVIRVKVLGTLALIDEGETDWKLLAINVEDPLASSMADVADIEKYFPGLLKATVEWFKIYKIPDGKPENKFAFNGEAKNTAFAHEIISEVHNFWKKLISKQDGIDYNEINCKNVTQVGNPFQISVSEAANVVAQSAAPSLPQEIDQSVDKWHFVTL